MRPMSLMLLASACAGSICSGARGASGAWSLMLMGGALSRAIRLTMVSSTSHALWRSSANGQGSWTAFEAELNGAKNDKIQQLADYQDKAAEILSGVCQDARQRKIAHNMLAPRTSISPTDAVAPVSTTSTLRATVTGTFLFPTPATSPVIHPHALAADM